MYSVNTCYVLITGVKKKNWVICAHHTTLMHQSPR